MLRNTKRFVTLFSEAVDVLMPERLSAVSEEESQSAESILAQHRKANLDAANHARGEKPRSTIPPEASRL